MDKSLTKEDLTAAYIISMNEREYAALVLLLPSADARSRARINEYNQGYVGIFGNIDSAEKQIEVLRSVADQIERNQADLEQRFDAQKAKIHGPKN
jgi:hypothetical protein